jgi:hypothetical protein
MDNAKEIAKLNDAYRRQVKVMVTQGVTALDDMLGVIAAVRAFDTFTEDSDPHHEHDFGSLVWKGEKIFWKFDYYDQNLKSWEDPLSRKCRRILTIMLASEY